MQTLGEVARVVINQDSIKPLERAGKMTAKERRARREHLIMEFIKSQPADAVLSGHQFMRVAAFPSPQTALHFLNRMVKDGLIIRVEKRQLGYIYAVNNRKAAKVEQQAKSPEIKAEIKQKAMEYVWENPQMAHQLKSFVDWLEAK